jgi:hypothetical protein
MAFSLDNLRDKAFTTIFGRRLALDSNDFLVGPKGDRMAIEDLTTVETTVMNYGVSRVITSGSTQGPTQHALPAPVVGALKYLMLASTSTGSAQFTSTNNGASIMTASDGTTANCVNLRHPGASVTLFGLTTAIWKVLSVTGSTTLTAVSFTTSTA